MEFNLNSASENKSNGKSYQEVGVFDNVKITAINSAINSNGNKYIQMETVNEKGEVGRTPQMYVTEKAWPITARSLVNLTMAINDVSEEEAKKDSNFSTLEQLTSKLSALLVGKPFRAKFKGEESSRGTIIAQLDTRYGIESMKVPKEQSKLTFNEERDIRKYVAPQTLENTTTVPSPF